MRALPAARGLKAPARVRVTRPAAVLATALEIAQGLAYLHSHDVVHGDLSAVNVLLQSTPGGNDAAGDATGRGFVAKLSDFGLSMQLLSPNEVACIWVTFCM